MLLVLLFVSSIVPFQADAPESLAHGYATGWNAHDAKALSELFADDADWVTASGSRMRGQKGIRDYLHQEHQSWARGTSMKVADVRVRSLTADAAVITFGWEITGEGRVFKGSTLLVAGRQQGRWQIVSGQVATAPAPR